MEPVPLLLVGCGMMGARHLRGYGELERVAPGHLDLVGVCDRDERLANAVADEAATLLPRRPAVFTDLDHAVRSGAVAADVVTPNRTHDAVATTLFQAGFDVLCEKPLGVTIARGRRVIDAAAAAGRILAVAENDRRDPTQRLLRYAVEAGLLGELQLVQQVSVEPGGKIVGTPWRHKLAMGGLPLDVWIHLAYGLESAAGPVESVDAQARLVEATRPWKRPDGVTEDVVCQGVDTLTARLKFANGADGTWLTSFATPGWGRFERIVSGTRATAYGAPPRSGRPLQIQGPAGKLEGDDLLAALPDWHLSGVEAALFGERPTGYQVEYPVTDRRLIAAELADFVTAVRTRQPPEVPGELGLRAVAVIYALLESAAAGQPVRVADVLQGDVAVVQGEVEAAGD